MRILGISLLSMVVLTVGAAQAVGDVVADFENGINNGNWFGINQNTWIMPTGGNPDAWLKATEGRGEPEFQFMPDPTNVFAGDYVSKGVTGFSVDLRADRGFDMEGSDGIGETLRLHWTNGGDYITGIEAWYTGPASPTIGAGWQSYYYPIPSSSLTIPAGWTIYEGNGTPGTDADWQFLMHNIDAVELIYGEIGYAFPVRTWDIGMDNVRLITPEPASALALLIGGALLISRRRPREL
ncbi:MAG TPA: PEP-CTERM sorting domain-containing protein [Phycisphaerae bacterium]|nr:PEP-CTERM sorting domain-containing protein [Phycisphaerae bacterium]